MTADGKLGTPPASAWACDHLIPPDDVFWQDKAAELKYTEGERVKAASEKWTAVLSSIIGIAGVTTLITSYEQLKPLTRDWQIAIVIMLLAALALVVYAIERAFHAEAGSLDSFDGTAQQTCDYISNSPRTKVKEMRRSRLASLVALALLVASMLALGFAPKSAASQEFLVLSEVGPAKCGVISTNADGTAVLTANDGSSILLAIEGKMELVEVSSCNFATPS